MSEIKKSLGKFNHRLKKIEESLSLQRNQLKNVPNLKNRSKTEEKGTEP